MEDIKVEVKGINILETELQKYKGEDAVISISHKLYGPQKIKTKLNCICDDQRIGFAVTSGQEIFIYRDQIVDYGVEGNIFFADDIMEITIKLQ